MDEEGGDPSSDSGAHDVDPLPPQLDTTAVYEDVRAGLRWLAQFQRLNDSAAGLQAVLGQDGLVNTPSVAPLVE